MDVRQADGYWRENILAQLNTRNKLQNYSFQELIACHNKIFESATALRSENLQLSIRNEQLRQENSEASMRSLPSDGKSSDKVQALEHKLLKKQDELTDLLRTKGENAQALVELNRKLNEKEKLLVIRDQNLMEAAEREHRLQQKLQATDTLCSDLKASSDTLKDEYYALHLAFEALQEKLRKAQEENAVLVERLMRIKAKDAEKLNEENENFVRKKQAKVAQELEEAAKDTGNLSPDRMAVRDLGNALPGFSTALPQRVVLKFDAHDGEVNAVRWSPVDRIVATGGQDRKVKLWDISKGLCEMKGTLVGSNAAVMSLDFDSTGTFLLAASNDFASRVWTIADERLRHTLTGHSGKVLAAKFLGQSARVVTGSYDRTLKVWDLRSRACIETKFAGSSCNDVVTSETFTFISGHFDKKIRFWDARSEGTTSSAGTAANELVLQGKITSLDLSKDGNYLLACVRDDTLRMFDLRMKQEVRSFSCDNFKVGCDWTRAMFSPNDELVGVGGADGGVFVWNARTGRIACESSQKEHSGAVTSIAWHTYGGFLASVDRGKKAIIWTGD
ncbi:autophagy-related protein 16-1 [Neocloeon triangulifer]|uniref:autophagy-related protein 16-1 n=1 Tax=Neocloeon triangulifer TaxID=2078957 RepID=UPI00286F3FAD|nr:autophagy-related protein 16-1 [Neocloeon triangulifer]